MTRTAPLLALALALPLAPAAGHAQAVLQVEFTQRQPLDTFLVSNVANCDGVSVSEVRINLQTAKGRIFFDTAPGAPGYPDDERAAVQFPDGRGYVRNVSVPKDGGSTVLLSLQGFSQGSTLHVGIDIDSEDPDKPGRHNDVTVRDLEGITVGAMIVNPAGERQAEIARMDDGGIATLAWDRACVGSGKAPFPAFED